MDEMEKRGYSPAPEWKILCIVANHAKHFDLPTVERNVPIYPEHDEVYLAECLANLEQKEFILPNITRKPSISSYFIKSFNHLRSS